LKSLEEQLEEYKKFNAAKNKFIVVVIRQWVEQLQLHDTAKQSCITDMLEFAEKLEKSAGVIILDLPENESLNDMK